MTELLAPLRTLFEYVAALPASIEFRGSFYVAPYTTVAHVLSMCFFAGLILVMDLRLLGAAFMRTPFSALQGRLFPLQMAGIVAAAGTGLVLAFGDPLRFYVNVLLDEDVPDGAGWHQRAGV